MIEIDEHIHALIDLAIAEDIPDGIDITSDSTIEPEQIGLAEYRLRKSGVVAGIPVAVAVLNKLGINDIDIPVTCAHQNSEGDVVLIARGKIQNLLLAERTTLNFLTHLSGIATLTRRWVDEVSGTQCQIRDTRKTTPGYRSLEKYAVRMGGGVNHRMSLSDAALIKDNHVVAAGGVMKAFESVRAKYPQADIEIEVDTLEQLRELLVGKPDLIMLDNMSVEQCREAVSIVKGKSKLEASGGITLERAKAYAETGIDFMAIGAITHSAPALDIGLDLRMES